MQNNDPSKYPNCFRCNKVIDRRIVHERNIHQFCSQDCYYAHMRETGGSGAKECKLRLIDCPECGTKKLITARRKKTKHCSPSCASKSHAATTIPKLMEKRTANWEESLWVTQPQIELYQLVKLKYPTATMEHVVGMYSLDIAIIEDKVNYEFDGDYWHRGREDHDRRRDDYLTALGWEIRRYGYPELAEASKRGHV